MNTIKNIIIVVNIIVCSICGYGQIIKHNSFASIGLGTQISTLSDSLERKQTNSPTWKYGDYANYTLSANLILPFWGKQKQDVESGISPRYWFRRLGLWSHFDHVSLAGDIRNQTSDRVNVGLAMRDRLMGVDVSAGIGSYRKKFQNGVVQQFTEYASNVAIYRPLNQFIYIDVLMRTHWYKNDHWNSNSDIHIILDLFKKIDNYGVNISEPIYHLGIGYFYQTTVGSGVILRYFPRNDINITGTYNLNSQTKIGLKNVHVFELSLTYLFEGKNSAIFPNVLHKRNLKPSKKVRCPDGHPAELLKKRARVWYL